MKTVSKDRAASPGPGFYDIKPSLDVPVFTIGLKHEERRRMDNPGPGHYNENPAVV
jgi:hypothetical protein